MQKHSLTFVPLLALILIPLSGCSRAPSPPASNEGAQSVPSTVSVAAASDLKFAFEEIISEFQKAHPEVVIETTFGSSGNFYSQLSNKAPFDIFFSADMDYPRKLIEQGDADETTQFQYAIGHIGIWVRNDSPLDLNAPPAAVLSNPTIQKVAIANPRFAPYGRAAEAALKHLEIYDTLKDRLVLGDNIAQTAQFIDTGAADIGIIAASIAQASPLKEKGKFSLISNDSHPPLRQGGVILSWARNLTACQALRSFVISESGQAILEKYGFDRPRD